MGRCPTCKGAQAVQEAQRALLAAGLGCFPCARTGQGLAQSDAQLHQSRPRPLPAAPGRHVPEAGRPGTSFRSSRERTVGGVPVTRLPTHTHTHSHALISVPWGVGNGCGWIVCTCCREGGGCRGGAGLPPPHWAVRPEACRAGLLVAPTSLLSPSLLPPLPLPPLPLPPWLPPSLWGWVGQAASRNPPQDLHL